MYIGVIEFLSVCIGACPFIRRLEVAYSFFEFKEKMLLEFSNFTWHNRYK